MLRTRAASAGGRREPFWGGAWTGPGHARGVQGRGILCVERPTAAHAGRRFWALQVRDSSGHARRGRAGDITACHPALGPAPAADASDDELDGPSFDDESVVSYPGAPSDEDAGWGEPSDFDPLPDVDE